MSLTPGFILTAAGAAAVAAALASTDSSGVVHFSAMAFGDAHNVAYLPNGSETALRNERARVSLDGVVRDPKNAGQVLITASLPAGVGGFDALEIGVILADGSLGVIGPANIHKPIPAEGLVADWTVTIALAVSAAAQVDVHLDDGAAVTAGYVLAHRQYFAVASATTAAPPAGAADEDQYLVPNGATGAWAQHGGQIAIWRAGQAAWLFVTTAVGSMAGAADTDASWRLTSSGWVRIGRFGGEATKASAATVDLGAASSNLVRITGTTPIAGFGASADLNAPLYFLRFTSAVTLVNSPALLLPGGGDVPTAPGDDALAQYLGAGVWRVLGLFPAGGFDRAGMATAAQNAAQAYTDARIATLVGGAPAALDTLAEIDRQIAADEGAAAALAVLVATKLSLSGGSMTGALEILPVASGADYTNVLVLRPNDFAAGKPGLFFVKLPGSSLGWRLVVGDPNGVSGSLDLLAGQVTAPTPEKGATGGRVITADALKAHGLDFGGQEGVVQNTTVNLTLADAGRVILLGHGSAATLPGYGQVPVGTAFILKNVEDTTVYFNLPANVGSDSPTQILNPGELVVLSSDGGGFYREVFKRRNGGGQYENTARLDIGGGQSRQLQYWEVGCLVRLLGGATAGLPSAASCGFGARLTVVSYYINNTLDRGRNDRIFDVQNNASIASLVLGAGEAVSLVSDGASWCTEHRSGTLSQANAHADAAATAARWGADAHADAGDASLRDQLQLDAFFYGMF